MSAEVPKSAVVQILTCRAGKDVEAHPKTDGLHRKLQLVREDGCKGAVNIWSDRNLTQSQLRMGAWEDNQRGIMRGVDRNRAFGVAQPCSQDSFEATGRSAAEAKAVLVVTGKLATGSASAYWAAAQEAEPGLGRTAGAIAGIVGQLFLQSLHDGTVGGCYLFADAEAMEAYAAEAPWGDMPWEGVAVDKFTLAGAEPAATASAA